MTIMPSTIDPAAVEAFAGTVATEIAAAASLGLAVVGDRLGLYAALAEAGPLTPSELAARTGCAERYVREWLANQAAGAWIVYDPETGRFALPAAHAAVIADETSPAFLLGSAQVVAALFRGIDALTEAFRTGEGIGWGEHHEDLHRGAARFFRTACQAALVPWVRELGDVAARLDQGGRIADVGCGEGGGALALAAAFPAAEVVGVDAHAPSIARAVDAADGRAMFVCAPADDLPAGPFDLITMLDCLHDLGDPVSAVRAALDRLAPGGALLVVEPAAADRLEDNLTPVARTYYATSTAFCTPCALAQPGGWALGNQAGPARTTDLLRRAGAADVRVVDTTPFQQVYEVRSANG